jgi:predicted RNA binding protein YcfA (HicA-like mRNA interferase family)
MNIVLPSPTKMPKNRLVPELRPRQSSQPNSHQHNLKTESNGDEAVRTRLLRAMLMLDSNGDGKQLSPRLPRPTSRELLRALRRAGWRELRVTGSHHHLGHPDRPGVLLTLAVHASQSVPIGTLQAILERAGISAEELNELL